ncbi:hypothetical protein NIES2104_08860 [Leptolyngbya sp. NIES-2104]|nr:hypothetical protein NIES2104_08860 [Leptolyngbya sp. NIES-2104]
MIFHPLQELQQIPHTSLDSCNLPLEFVTLLGEIAIEVLSCDTTQVQPLDRYS